MWFFPAARCAEFREPRSSTESCKSRKCRFYSYAFVPRFDFKVLINLLDLSGLGFANELQTCIPESRLVRGALSAGLVG